MADGLQALHPRCPDLPCRAQVYWVQGRCGCVSRCQPCSAVRLHWIAVGQGSTVGSLPNALPVHACSMRRLQPLDPSTLPVTS